MRRLFSRLLPFAAPHAVRFNRFVIVFIPGAGTFQMTHEQAAKLAAQLSPSLNQR